MILSVLELAAFFMLIFVLLKTAYEQGYEDGRSDEKQDVFLENYENTEVIRKE